MSRSEERITEAARKALAAVAPETRGSRIEPDANFRDQFEIDSIDFVGFVMALDKELGVTTPETDYPKLSSLGGCVRYFSDGGES